MSNTVLTNMLPVECQTGPLSTAVNVTSTNEPDGFKRIQSTANSARSIMTVASTVVRAGKRYAAICKIKNVVGVIANMISINPNTATVSYVGTWLQTRSTDGHLVRIFDCITDGIVNVRFGLNPAAAAGMHPMSVDIGEVTLMDITGQYVPFVPFVPWSKSVMLNKKYECANVSGLPLFTNATDVEVDPYDVCMVIGDSFGNQSYEWPQIISLPGKVLYSNCISGRSLGAAVTDIPNQINLVAFNENGLATYAEFPNYCQRPGTIVLAIGINDVLGGVTLETYKSRVSLAISACGEDKRILLLDLPPFENYEDWTQPLEDVRSAINNWIVEYSASDTTKKRLFKISRVLGIAPLYQKLKSEYDLDGLHPGTTGCTAIANALPAYFNAPYGNWFVTPTAKEGPPRNNITSLSGTSTAINPTDTYQFSDTNGWRVVTGWTAGTANDFFDADGVPIPFLGQKLIDVGIGYQLYYGQKGVAGYTIEQDAKSHKKIVRFLRVNTYIDSILYDPDQDYNW